MATLVVLALFGCKREENVNTDTASVDTGVTTATTATTTTTAPTATTQTTQTTKTDSTSTKK